METKELQDLWKKYDAKLEKSWNLNIKLITEMNMQKAKSSMKTFTWWKIGSLLMQFLVAQFLVNYIIDNFQHITLTIPAYMLGVLTYIALIWNMYQLGLILTINYKEPILTIQKKIEKLKIQKLRYNKFLFYGSYPYVFLMAFIVLHIDLLLLPIKWMIPNIFLAVTWVPFCYWLIKKYNSRETKSAFWRSLSNDSSLTPDTASKSINNSLSFLKEIKQFEKSN